MKISLIGYGKMGKMIEEKALKNGHDIVSIIDPALFGNEISEETVGSADVCIEFTSPSSVSENLLKLISLKKQIVVGTTGWESSFSKIETLVKKNQIGLFFSENFSIGANLFISIVQEAAKKILPLGLYEAAGIEAHHSQKQDTPSGTARAILRAISDAVGKDSNIPFTSLRLGAIPGTHSLLFDSLSDTITLTHTARNREGFAEGALAAAQWMEKKTGLFTMRDFIEAINGSPKNTTKQLDYL